MEKIIYKFLPDSNPTNISCCYKACCCKSHLYVKKIDFCGSTKLVQLDTPQSEFVAEQHVDICRVDKKFYSI